MALTDTAVRKAKPEARPYNLTDGAGLYLQVMPNGGKLWRWNYRHEGKQKTMAPDVLIADAREARQAERKMKATGADPMAQRKLDKIAGVVARELTDAESIASPHRGPTERPLRRAIVRAAAAMAG